MHFTLRNGLKVFLSSNQLDPVTVMVIFCKQEYGKVNVNDAVIDIGANIGCFSLYAAINGAEKVYAFEPNKEAYKILCKNIEENNLTNVIIPYNLAVTDENNTVVTIPRDSSPLIKLMLLKKSAFR